MSFHVNPETGNPGVCRAKVKCRFGDLASDHYPTREEAQAAFESTMKTRELTEQLEAKSLEVRKLWGTMRAQFTETKSRWGGTSSSFTGDHEIYKASQVRLHEVLKEADVIHEQLLEPIEPHEPDFPMGMGFVAAQEELMVKLNNKPESYKDDEDGVYYTPDVVPHMREMTARYFAGERFDDSKKIGGFTTPATRLLIDLSGESNATTMSSNEVYSVLVFPEKDLKPELERAKVEDFSVSYFTNGRENGLVYTVLQPDGNSRSFSLYEHRNSDSMIINCVTNWDPETETAGPRPRDGRSSHDFIAEIEGTDKRRQAATLTYFLKAAQRGELESDTELMMKAEKLDWTAILSEKLPGFGEWAKEQGWDPDAKREFEE